MVCDGKGAGSDEQLTTGRCGRRTFMIKVFGCQMNVCDGDRLRTSLLSSGWDEVDDADDADFVVFITCSIRDKAEQKAQSEIGRLRLAWERRRSPRCAVIGCMAQRTGGALMDRFPWVFVTAGPRHIGDVPDAIERAMRGERVRLIDADPRDVHDLMCSPTPKSDRHKAYVTIAHGCDQFCSYCIVPHVRGRFGSRAPEAVVDEVRSLAGRGAVEVTLLGQNVNTYGRDIGMTFSSLLRRCAEIDGIARLRFVTSHPLDFTDDILDAMTEHDNICPSINLPVQSGNDKVLREMNRKYTRDRYLDTVRRIRDALPECGLTTDIIAGFPGETRAEFEDSLSLLREVRFDLIHSAAYSEREGTPAAARTDQIDKRERAARLNELNRLQFEISEEINRSLIGRTFRVLFDEPAPRGEGLLQGRTATDKVVLVKAGAESIGTFADVKITGASPWCLEGERL